ncbi:MAG: HAD family hydrolase [Bacteroidota bacterium]
MLSKESLNKIQLVVCDLDGTLLNNNNQVGESTIQLVKELKKVGVLFSIATGRLHNAVLSYANLLDIKIPIITLDGTFIKDTDGNNIIFKSYVPVRYVKRALKLADRYYLKAALCQDSAIYFTEDNSVIQTLLEKNDAVFEQVDSYDNHLDNTLEVLLTGDRSSNIKTVADKMAFPYTFGIRSNYYKSQSHGGVYYIEIRKIGASKGEGLANLCKHLKIDIENTAVIGDWYNDKSLFDTEAVKIAVANAVPELKKTADFITKKSNDENGIIEFLEMLLRAKQ